MTVVLDSSALVKRYADEPHQEMVRGLTAGLVVSDVVRVEVPSALWRKHREGELNDTQIRVLVALFEDEWSSRQTGQPVFSSVAMSTEVLTTAAVQVSRHPLRALDGIQLATALLAQRHLGAVRFACFGDRLRLAAQREGLALIP